MEGVKSNRNNVKLRQRTLTQTLGVVLKYSTKMLFSTPVITVHGIEPKASGH